MIQRVTNSPIQIFALLVLAMLLGGCGCSQRPVFRTVHVNLGDDLRNQEFRTIEVEIIYVQENQVQRWQGKDVIEYFAGGDTLRASAENRKQRFFFNPGDEGSKTFGDDPEERELIGRWLSEGATHIFVLAKLPGHERIGRFDGPASADPRKQAIPLSGCSWSEADIDDQDIRVTVRQEVVELSPSVPMGQ